MGVLLDIAYLAAGVAAAPVLVLKSRRTGKYRTGWAARLGFGDEPLWPDLPSPHETPAPRPRVLLLHCVSVGELNSVQTLLARLLAADPHLRVVVSTTTDTGTDRASKLFSPEKTPRVRAVRFPLDFSFAVERLFDRVRPDAVALVELETWPNFLAIARSRRIPVAVVNGRLSERSFPRYRLIRPLMAGMLRNIDWLGVQTASIANRFIALGADPDRVEVIPTLKYDNAQVGSTVPGQDALARAMGLAPEHQLMVGGSTGPGEEEALLAAYGALRGRYPALRLAIVPRHPEVVAQVAAAVRGRGWTPVFRTDRPDPPPSPVPPANSAASVAASVAGPALGPDDVFILNTMGELRKLYAQAFGVFVGRSLVKLGGSDMIEAAALGKPTCFGPYTHNFAEVVELLVQGGGAAVVSDAAALQETWEKWLRDPEDARRTGELGKQLIERQKGSTDRYVERLLALLYDRTAARGGGRRSGGQVHQPADGGQPQRHPSGD
jgi:3-deoxy-D-manno-octulosonic-acid transferase